MGLVLAEPKSAASTALLGHNCSGRLPEKGRNMAILHGCDSSRHDDNCVARIQVSITENGAITCVVPHLEWRARLDAIRFAEALRELGGGTCLRHPVYVSDPADARATLSHELLAVVATSDRSAR